MGGAGGGSVAGLATALATASVPWGLGRPDVVLRNSAEADLIGAVGFLAGLPEEPVHRSCRPWWRADVISAIRA
ncbi:hypothetical protein [Streptomyces sp. NPDC051776]|uniref:hypothetical protein n=1 Tax=Streptomyces sp. NPDC051776 TaxID=3155414 RepID=UPI003435642A